MNKIILNGQVLIDIDELKDKYTRTEIDSMISSVYKYRGSIESLEALQRIENKNIGDCYNVESDGINRVWNGTSWDSLSGLVDLTDYYNKTQVDNRLKELEQKMDSKLGDINSILQELTDYHEEVN